MVVSTITRASSGTLALSSSDNKLSSPFKYEELQVQFDSTTPIGPSSPSPTLIQKCSSIHEVVISSLHMNSSDSESEASPEKLRQKVPLLKTVPKDEFSDSEAISITKNLEEGIEKAITSEHQVDVKLSLTLPLKQRLIHSIRTMTWQGGVRIAILFALVVGITTFLGFLIGSNHVQTSMVEVLEWLSKLPKWAGSLLMAGMYMTGLMLFCPGTPFNLAAGFLFGVWIGIGVAMAGCI